MKRLMIIAVIISGMLMPAQIYARNDRNDRNDRRGENRVQMDYNRAKKDKGGKVVKHYNKPQGNKHGVVKHYNNHKPAPPVVVHHHKPAPPVVVHHHKPAPPVVVHHHKPAPPVVVHHHTPAPPVVVHHHCNNDAAKVAAVAIGVAGLISILAD